MLTLAGDTVKTLDLEGCDLDPSFFEALEPRELPKHVEAIVNTVQSLKALQILDLAGGMM